MEYTIEQATDDDWPAILKVLKSANMHHIPSKEMPELDLSLCFVARAGGDVVGIGGYKMLSATQGKTTLLAVDPNYRHMGIGEALQLKRMEKMMALGAKKIITNADRPEAIAWYKRHFGYKEVGTLKKFHEFGLPDVDHWTTLELDIGEWREMHGA